MKRSRYCRCCLAAVFFAVVFTQVAVLQAQVGRKPLGKAQIPVEPSQMPTYVFEQLKKDPYVKEHFGWKLAYCQHPMYLLIDEDRGEPAVGERIAPWGAPNAEQYVERVRRNLRSLRELPDLKLNYQWSAVELESMVRKFPDVYEEMKELYKKGSLDFIDGSYSQAHLQVLGSESNWRQFEYGLEVYRRLFGKKVDVYARQEVGLHMQLPQLLRKFGYRFMTLPDFTTLLETSEGPFEIVKFRGWYEPIAGSEFIEAVGLDGSTVPAYLMQRAEQDNELQQDLYSGPKIWFRFPDLKEVSKSTYEQYISLFDWVLLRDALAQRYAEAPARAKVKVTTVWSYTEGVWAEELARTIRSAEQAAVLAEAIWSMGQLAGLGIDKSSEIQQIWKEILKSQHHDISWIEVTDLRRKSINRLNAAIEKCRRITNEVGQALTDDRRDFLSVFNGLPRPRKAVVVIDGVRCPGDGKFQHFDGRCIGIVELPAGGAKSFRLGGPVISRKAPLPQVIQADGYRVGLDATGLVTQITTDGGAELLTCDKYLGGEIKARIDRKWYDNRAAQCSFYTGNVCDIVQRETSLATIPLKERYYFFKDLPVIKVELEFDFNGDEVGYFWIDETKINVYWPTRGKEVYHDIPFGYVQGRQQRPLLVTNWLYCGGLVYVNCGTPKHWVRDGVMANVIGWGSNVFSNRHHWRHWVSRPQYDIRLYGKQKIEYYLLPVGRFDGNQIVKRVDNLLWPVFTSSGRLDRSFYRLDDDQLSITCVYPKDGRVWLRGYKPPSGQKSQYRDWEIFNRPAVAVPAVGP